MNDLDQSPWRSVLELKGGSSFADSLSISDDRRLGCQADKIPVPVNGHCARSHEMARILLIAVAHLSYFICFIPWIVSSQTFCICL